MVKDQTEPGKDHKIESIRKKKVVGVCGLGWLVGWTMIEKDIPKDGSSYFLTFLQAFCEIFRVYLEELWLMQQLKVSPRIFPEVS